MKLLHFADAHIDMANYGRHDPASGLPLRVLDFLKSLDTIVDAAIDRKVDLVIFAGDAYKDRSPAPTFQREWGRRIMRLSQAKIPTLLLVGNHDISPAVGRAHALQEYDTLQVPFVRVISKIQLLKSNELWGLPINVISIPWISRSVFLADYEITNSDDLLAEAYEGLENRIKIRIEELIEESEKSFPLILTAHASIEGAKYGGERLVMLGNDLVLTGSLVKNQKFNYVAMGHIHKPQNLNGPGPDKDDTTPDFQPPVVYPGSIERVDFGEMKEDRFFVVAEIEKGKDTKVEWVQLKEVRKFIDCRAILESGENVTEILKNKLPKPKELSGAILRLVVEYPREWDSLIDESALRKYAADAFEFHFVKRPQIVSRSRIDEGQVVSSLSPLDLLDQYFNSAKITNPEDLKKLAQEIISEDG